MAHLVFVRWDSKKLCNYPLSLSFTRDYAKAHFLPVKTYLAFRLVVLLDCVFFLTAFLPYPAQAICLPYTHKYFRTFV